MSLQCQRNTQTDILYVLPLMKGILTLIMQTYFDTHLISSFAFTMFHCCTADGLYIEDHTEVSTLRSGEFEILMKPRKGRRSFVSSDKYKKIIGNANMLQIVYRPSTDRLHTVYTPSTHRLHTAPTPSTHSLHTVYTPSTHRLHTVYTPSTQHSLIVERPYTHSPHPV